MTYADIVKAHLANARQDLFRATELVNSIDTCQAHIDNAAIQIAKARILLHEEQYRRDNGIEEVKKPDGS